MTDSSNSGVGSITTDPVDDIQPSQTKAGQEAQAPAQSQGHGHVQRHGLYPNPCHSWNTTLATRFQEKPPATELAAVKREVGECQTAILAAWVAQLAAQDRVEQIAQLVEDFTSVDADLGATEGELGEVELILDGLSTMDSWV